jgi:glycosyltransferase involved in cell wall biosynthesis
MRELALAQLRSSFYKGVGIGVICDSGWPKAYREELHSLNVRKYTGKTAKLFGTASFIYQRLMRPGIEAWINDFARYNSVEHVILHFHNAWMTGVFLPFRPLGFCSVNVVATFHGVNTVLQEQPVRRAIHRWMAQRLLRYGAKLTSVDKANPPLAEKVFGLPKGRFAVISNGVPQVDRRACPSLRGSGGFVVGQVGALIERKGWRIAAEAVLAVKATGRNVHLVIAGHGPDEADVRALVIDHPETVTFRGFVSNPQETLLPDLDLMAVMSVHEGLPMTIIEAMSTGLPVVATNVGGIPEAVADGKTGYLIERSAKKLADVIMELYDNPNLLAKMSEQAHQAFLERFSVDRIVSLYDSVYRAGNPERQA